MVLAVMLSLSLCAQTSKYKSFQSLLTKAEGYYKSGDYKKAISIIDLAMKSTDETTSSLEKSAKSLKSKCREKIDSAVRDANRLNVYPDTLYFKAEGGADTIRVDAGQPAKVMYVSNATRKCQVEKIDGTKAVVRMDKNENTSIQSYVVTVAMGNNKRTVQVVQDGRELTRKNLTVTTIPSGARITIDNKTRSYEWSGVLTPGDYEVRVEKDGYEVEKKTITIQDDCIMDEELADTVKLIPRFASIFIQVDPEEGFAFLNGDPVIRVNDNHLVSSSTRSYESLRQIQYDDLYSDGSVPVYPGQSRISMEARHFKPLDIKVEDLREGEVRRLFYTLEAIQGKLCVIDDGNAYDADVEMDGEVIGQVRDLISYPVLEGRHQIKISKDGLLPREEVYEFEISEDRTTVVHVRMDRFKRFVVMADQMCSVMVDGRDVGMTPTNAFIVRDTIPNYRMQVSVKKAGYMTKNLSVLPDFSSPATDTLRCTMTEAYVFTLTTDRPDIYATIKDKENGKVVGDNQDKAMPLTTMLPWSDKPYYVELRRVGEKRKAYRGHFKFNENTKDHRYIQSWSKSNLQVLGLTYYVLPFKELSMELDYAQFTSLGNVNLFNFRIFDGFSTSAVRSNVFLKGDWSAPEILPTFTILFLNADFRIGGGIFDYMDANALVSYAWYPDIVKKVLPLSHMTGHDLFLGGEISSRFPVGNIGIRFGYQQYFALTYNQYQKKPGTNAVEDCFTPVNMGNPTGQFVIGVTFTLGGTDSKGNNILRLF